MQVCSGPGSGGGAVEIMFVVEFNICYNHRLNNASIAGS